MPRIKGTSLFYHFGHDLGPWYLGFGLASGFTWEQVKESVTLRRLEKSPSERYGLTKMASDLFSWLVSKNYEKFDLHLSPDVEKDLKLGVGIDIEQIGKNNLRQLFDLLCQEITKRPSLKPKSFLGRKDSMIPPFISFSARRPTWRKKPFEPFSPSFGNALSKERGIAFEMCLGGSQKTSIARKGGAGIRRACRSLLATTRSS
jgi:hypothetical protein